MVLWRFKLAKVLFQSLELFPRRFPLASCQRDHNWRLQNGKERWLLSVRFIRAEATFLRVSVITCFRWHGANGELETIVSR